MSHNSGEIIVHNKHTQTDPTSHCALEKQNPNFRSLFSSFNSPNVVWNDPHAVRISQLERTA